MTKVVLVILLAVFCHTLTLGQDEQSPKLIRENGIYKIETYYIESDASQDSLLTTISYFNPVGRRVEIEIYDSLQLNNHYEYDYLFDSIKVVRRTYFRNELQYTATIENDEYGNELYVEEYDTSGLLSFKYNFTYNSQQQPIHYICYDSLGIINEWKKEYFESGNLKKYEQLWPKPLRKVLNYKDVGGDNHNVDSKYYRSVSIFENYNNSGNTMEQIESRNAQKVTLLGINGALELAPFDVLLDQIYYHDSGLKNYHRQYVNNKLVGIKKFRYFKF